MTTPLMTNLRKLCEYASDSDPVDDYLEQSGGKLQCVVKRSVIHSPSHTLSCVRAKAWGRMEPLVELGLATFVENPLVKLGASLSCVRACCLSYVSLVKFRVCLFSVCVSSDGNSHR